MERLSTIIQKLYQKYTPVLEAKGVAFNLDFPDTTLTFDQNSNLEKNLRNILEDAVKRTSSGSVSLTIHPEKIIIKDTGTPLPKSTCEKIKTDTISAKSRVGFGNEITMKF